MSAKIIPYRKPEPNKSALYAGGVHYFIGKFITEAQKDRYPEHLLEQMRALRDSLGRYVR